MTRLAPLTLALLLAACSTSQPAEAPTNTTTASASPAGLTTAPLTIASGGKAHRLTVELAVTPEEQEKGLMFRTSLAPDAGMLFPFVPPRTATFWMKNTVIPLDLLFIRTDGAIVRIAAQAQPYSQATISANQPVMAVLELAGGRAAELGLKEGDRVSWGCPAPAGQAPVALPGRFCP
jgi:hypothetical protein